MKIYLSTKPEIAIGDEAFFSETEEDKGALSLEEAIDQIQHIDWSRLAQDLQKAVHGNQDVTMDTISAPSFNLYHEGSEAELYVEILGDDYFDAELFEANKEALKGTKIDGLNFEQVIENVHLFYAQDVNRIRSYSIKGRQKESAIKKILVQREKDQAAKAAKNNFNALAVVVILVIIVYLLMGAL